jgi:hypothetical protein
MPLPVHRFKSAYEMNFSKPKTYAKIVIVNKWLSEITLKRDHQDNSDFFNAAGLPVTYPYIITQHSD